MPKASWIWKTNSIVYKKSFLIKVLFKIDLLEGQSCTDTLKIIISRKNQLRYTYCKIKYRTSDLEWTASKFGFSLNYLVLHKMKAYKFIVFRFSIVNSNINKD